MLDPVDSSVDSDEETEFLQVAQMLGGGILGNAQLFGDFNGGGLTGFFDDLVDFRLPE